MSKSPKIYKIHNENQEIDDIDDVDEFEKTWLNFGINSKNEKKKIKKKIFLLRNVKFVVKK